MPLTKTGSERVDNIYSTLIMAGVAVVAGLAVAKMGMVIGIALIAIPLVFFFLGLVFNRPTLTLTLTLWASFFVLGVSRYVSAPWGLLIDIFLFLGWLAILFQVKKKDWSPLSNGVMIVTVVWFSLVLLEIVNPESNGPECWFYAMRGDGFYQLMAFGLVFMLFKDRRQMESFMKLSTWLSIIGTLWGLRQMIFGVDAAEYSWLYVEGFASTHILAGVLRVFSFYSDAGQFGSSQAMFALMCGIITLSPVPMKEKVFYGFATIMTFVGFGISGTRGAVAVPGVGIIVYLFLSKNFKVLIIGLVMAGGVFVFFKYTMALQNVEQVRRMRTAFDPNDPSLLVRINNQKTFGRHLATRPFGGGIGAAGYWGFRFAPYSLLGNTATDSYYVKLWAETGIIGICLHLFMFGFFIGKGGFVIWHLRDPALKAKIAGIYCGMCGIFMANYGNAVYSQLPTAIILGVLIPCVFLAPKYDDDITAEALAKEEAEKKAPMLKAA